MARTTERVWAARVDRWRASGLTVAAFARAKGLNAVTLGLWKRRLAQRETAESVTFVELPNGQPASRPAFVLDLAGCRVEVAADFDAEALTRLLTVVEQRR